MSERVRLLRTDWQRQQPDLRQRRIWFLDETGVNLSLARSFGRAFGGHRAMGNVPKNYGTGVTVLGAMRGDGKLATLEVRGATDELVMLAFIREILAPVLDHGDVVVMDNLTSHKTQRVQKAFADLGVEVLYLPPYSPDLNPIEMCWSKFKAILRQISARSYEMLSEAISNALQKITAADARSWIRHCGYE
jgi:transposase